MPRPIYGFMHIACMNHWRDVVNDQIKKIMESGLFEATSKIYWCILGDPENLLFNPIFMSKVEIVFRSPDLLKYEFPTIQVLDETCRVEDCDVWYIHTKGVSYADKRGETWRNFMEWFTLIHWRDCVKALEDHDAAGAMYYAAHFKGNFWWTKSSHVRHLVSPGALLHYGRDGGERWIFSFKQKYPLKVKNFWPVEWGIPATLPPVPPT